MAPTPESETITRLLQAWRGGDAEAMDRLIPLVYDELRELAHAYMRREDGGVLQTTALVHEAYLRLVGLDVDWQDRHHFFALAARAMRRILVDFARMRRAGKRGGPQVTLPLEVFEPAQDPPSTNVIALDNALRNLAALDERKSHVLELRYFGGMTIRETAEVLKISHATVEREMKFAKAWLLAELAPGTA